MTEIINEIMRKATAEWGNDEAVGNACDIHRATIWKIRTGVHKKPRASTIGRIVRALAAVGIPVGGSQEQQAGEGNVMK